MIELNAKEEEFLGRILASETLFKDSYPKYQMDLVSIESNKHGMSCLIPIDHYLSALKSKGIIYDYEDNSSLLKVTITLTLDGVCYFEEKARRKKERQEELDRSGKYALGGALITVVISFLTNTAKDVLPGWFSIFMNFILLTMFAFFGLYLMIAPYLHASSPVEKRQARSKAINEILVVVGIGSVAAFATLGYLKPNGAYVPEGIAFVVLVLVVVIGIVRRHSLSKSKAAKDIEPAAPTEKMG